VSAPAARRARRTLLAGAAALALAALLGACSTPPSPAAGAPLRVASDLDNPPFAFVRADGTPAGRDVEMCAALAQRLGRPLEWVRLPFDELLPAVQAGRVDAACATLGITPERDEVLDFSLPYFRTALAVVVRAAPDAPATLDALAGRRVGAGLGTTSERALRQRLPAAVPVLENKAGLPARQRLESREVDALVLDGPAADALVAASDGALRRLPGTLGPELYALALPSGSPLREPLDRALRALELDGTQARLDAAHGLASARPR